MKDFLTQLIERKKSEIAKLKKRSDESDDITEVRSIGENLATIRDEINEAEAQLAKLEDDGGDGDGSGGDEGRDTKPPVGAEARGGNPMMSYGNFEVSNGEHRGERDPYDTAEYRSAFMEYVCRNTPIPVEFRADQTTSLSDVGAVIPTTIVNEIIRKMDSYGNILAKVRRLNIPGGVEVPISDIVPVATWVGEGASEDQKLGSDEKVVFSFYGLECKMAQSLLVSVTTLQMFQDLFATLALEAITRALETAFIKGTGSSQPMGVTVDPRIPSANTIALTSSEIASWALWKKKVFSKMKKAYRNGEFYMSQATFDSYIDGMVDSTGQPIGRVNYGTDKGEVYRFGGKNVETVEDELIPSFDEASAGDVIGIFIDWSKYGMNSNMELTAVKWVDNDKNKVKNKLILIVDGKILDPYGVLIIKKADSGSEEDPTGEPGV